jgi:hypothetical protein
MLLNEAKNAQEREMLMEVYTNLWTADIASNGLINELAPLAAIGGAIARGGAAVGRAAATAGSKAAQGVAKAGAQAAKATSKAATKTARAAKGAAKNVSKNLKDQAKKKVKQKVQDMAMDALSNQEKQEQQKKNDALASADSGDPDSSLSWMSDAQNNIEKAMNGFKNLNSSADSLQTNIEQCFNSIQNDDVRGIMTRGAEDALSNLQSAYEQQLKNIVGSITSSAEESGLGMDEAQVKSAAIVSMAAAIAKLTKEIATAT